MATKSMTKVLPQYVRDWVLREAQSRTFDMPAGMLSGKDALLMLARGIDTYSDYDPDEIVDVLTEAARS